MFIFWLTPDSLCKQRKKLWKNTCIIALIAKVLLIKWAYSWFLTIYKNTMKRLDIFLPHHSSCQPVKIGWPQTATGYTVFPRFLFRIQLISVKVLSVPCIVCSFAFLAHCTALLHPPSQRVPAPRPQRLRLLASRRGQDFFRFRCRTVFKCVLLLCVYVWMCALICITMKVLLHA